MKYKKQTCFFKAGMKSKPELIIQYSVIHNIVMALHFFTLINVAAPESWDIEIKVGNTNCKIFTSSAASKVMNLKHTVTSI